MNCLKELEFNFWVEQLFTAIYLSSDRNPYYHDSFFPKNQSVNAKKNY